MKCANTLSILESMEEDNSWFRRTANSPLAPLLKGTPTRSPNRGHVREGCLPNDRQPISPQYDHGELLGKHLVFRFCIFEP